MSETSYEQCHISYRGYMDKEIDTAREVLRKYGKPCVDAVKELRSETDMPMSECANMLRCLWRDAEIEHVKSENAKLRELVRRLISHVEHPPCEGCGFEMNCDGEHVTQCDEWLFMVADARKLGVEVDE